MQIMRAEMEIKMDYVNAFWVGGLICRSGTDFDGKNENDAGKNYGASGGDRGGYQCCRLV